MDIIISGANGRMGRMLTETAKAGQAAGKPWNIAARVDISLEKDPAAGTFSAPDQFTGSADVVIDFSSHAATKTLTEYCLARSLPLVVATTGQTGEELELIRAASAKIPVFLSANMSLGVALVADLVRRAALVLPDAEIEILEHHHDQKLDVPSGTALLLASRITEVRPDSPLVVGRHENGRRSPREIGIHSLRYGSEVGTHEVLFSTGRETVTLRHKAEDRSLFAQGALTAAAFLIGKAPGLYDMRDLVKQGAAR
ncbi:MAG: 4-hydroxy-tetrahydrodipicolinate reductase [Fretibacterium sp.]|nr:4-hydroxy-tetrahydrodipicolinate reductase [Fretibacterium sp.]